MVQAVFRYYGISPWEVEVLYGYFRSRFDVVQDEIEPDDADFVSKLSLHIPVAFSEEFFAWFDFRRWEKVKSLFKEIKRRRGSGNALKINLIFIGEPSITFTMDSEDRQWFDNSVEKMDFVLELLPYHLDREKIPPGTTNISYRFDSRTIRWRLHRAIADKEYMFRGDGWAPIEE